MYYHICPHCGASLDPGERCGCIKRKAASAATEQGKEMCVYNTNHTFIVHATDEEREQKLGEMIGIASDIVRKINDALVLNEPSEGEGNV